MTFSDVIIVTGWNLVNPIFAVYITKQIQGGGLELIGFCTAIYLILRATLQLPFSRFIDSHKGEMDDFLVMAIGSLLTSLMPFMYIFATKPVHVLVIQGITGTASAMVSPGWLAIFTRHISKNSEAQSWGLYNSLVSYAGALAGALSGFMADKFGFKNLYLIVGIVCTFGTSFLFFVYQDIRDEEKKLNHK